MKSPKPSFYVLIAIVFAALLYVINLYRTTEGFDPEIMAHFQNMPADQQNMVCKTLNDQLTSYADQMKNATPEQVAIMQQELADLKKAGSKYGC